jgi:antagonist of KipI
MPEAEAYLRAGGARVRVIPGPQSEHFPPDAIDVLERTRFIISPQSNRMGYRLQGGRVPRLEDQEMISDAAFTGAIQIPSSGEPILLMADHQTTGGYPQLAVVITADLPLAGQLSPGDWIEFRTCSRSEALSALVAQEARLLAFE